MKLTYKFRLRDTADSELRRQARADARREKVGYWEYNNPKDKFRVVKYTPAE